MPHPHCRQYDKWARLVSVLTGQCLSPTAGAKPRYAVGLANCTAPGAAASILLQQWVFGPTSTGSIMSECVCGCAVLRFTVLHFDVLHFDVLHFDVLHFDVLHFDVNVTWWGLGSGHFDVLHCHVLHFDVLHLDIQCVRRCAVHRAVP